MLNALSNVVPVSKNKILENDYTKSLISLSEKYRFSKVLSTTSPGDRSFALLCKRGYSMKSQLLKTRYLQYHNLILAVSEKITLYEYLGKRTSRVGKGMNPLHPL